MEERAKARRISVNVYHVIREFTGRVAAQAYQAEIEQSDGKLASVIEITRRHLGITVMVDEFQIEQAEKAAEEEERQALQAAQIPSALRDEEE